MNNNVKYNSITKGYTTVYCNAYCNAYYGSLMSF